MDIIFHQQSRTNCKQKQIKENTRYNFRFHIIFEKQNQKDVLRI